jgi:SAM-dependent methyltransferase
MEALGRVVEKAIGRAKRAKVQVGSRGGVQPVLSLESQLSTLRIKELIDEATKAIVAEAIPDIMGEPALEICEGPASYASRLLGANAATAVSVEIGGALTEKQGDLTRGFVVQAKPSRLPFAGQSFRYIVGRLATPHQGDVVKGIAEIGRVLKPGGQGIIVDYHPFGLYAKRGSSRMRSMESTIRKFEDYYRLCRKAGLRVVDLREVFIDETMRSMFSEEEIGAYRSLKGTPLVAFLFLYKLRKKVAGEGAQSDATDASQIGSL